MKISQDIRRDAMAQNDAGGSLTEAEAGMAEMSAKFRAGGGVVGAFDDPFFAQQMSDGTLKVFAYLLLLEDPEPPPFICIEEPENGLYHKLLETLAEEFRAHATGKRNAPQIFVTTHQPYFVDALSPKEVWILEKGKNGFSQVRRASDLKLVTNLVDEGLPLGGLWYSDYLDAI
jgi:predicted ATPase